jgi:hypothetical protein
MFEDDFLEMMVDSVTWEPFAGNDANGNRTYGTSQTLQCRISPKHRQTQTDGGAIAVSKSTIYFAGAPDISPKDRLTLPNGDQPPILTAGVIPDRDGAHHTEVTI